MLKNGEVFRAMPHANTGIIPKRNIQYPMEFVFDMPMRADRAQQLLRIIGERGDEIACNRQDLI